MNNHLGKKKNHLNDTLQVFLQKSMTSQLSLPTIIMAFTSKVPQQWDFFKDFSYSFLLLKHTNVIMVLEHGFNLKTKMNHEPLKL
jgi:hypothetical protein